MRNKGFMFVELMIVIGIISVGLVAAMTMINRTQSEINVVRWRLTATYLAQEGMEVVRSIRDRNYVNNVSCWSEGIYEDENGEVVLGIVSYDSENVQPVGGSVNNYPEDARLFLHDNSYHHDISVTSTEFFRIIEIRPEEDYLEIDVYVFWEGGSTHLSSVLYNWLGLNCDE